MTLRQGIVFAVILIMALVMVIIFGRRKASGRSQRQEGGDADAGADLIEAPIS